MRRVPYCGRVGPETGAAERARGERRERDILGWIFNTFPWLPDDDLGKRKALIYSGPKITLHCFENPKMPNLDFHLILIFEDGFGITVCM